MSRHALKSLLLALALALAAFPAAAQSNTGSANFTTYVAVGDSLTAGFSSASLVQTVQRTSYPALIARQAKGTTTGFEQPLVSEPGLPPGMVLLTLRPTFGTKPGPPGGPVNLNVPRPYNNLGIPGARVHDIVATTSGGIYDLVLRNPAFQNTTALQQAASLHPTFATIWIGNNDVLAAATSGRVIEGVTLTPVASFQADLTLIANTLRGAGASLAIANIPNVTSIPFVTTIRPIVVNPATNQPVLVGGNTVPLLGPDGPLGANDHVLLTAAAQLAVGRGIPAAIPGGTGLPLTDDVVLSASETSTINARVDAYNQVISSVASATNAALVDMHEQLNLLATEGIEVGGVPFNAAFLTGGIFSYDGVHPNTFGYAYVANAFIDAINAKYGGDIPPVDLFPFMFGPSEVIATPASAPAGDPLLSKEAIRNLFWWGLGMTDPADGPPVPRKPNQARRQKPGRGHR